MGALRAVREWFIYADGGQHAAIYLTLFYGYIGVLIYGRWLSDPVWFAEVWHDVNDPLHQQWAAAIAPPNRQEP